MTAPSSAGLNYTGSVGLSASCWFHLSRECLYQEAYLVDFSVFAEVIPFIVDGSFVESCCAPSIITDGSDSS